MSPFSPPWGHLRTLPGAFLFHVLNLLIHMQCVAMLSKQLRSGATSTWEFWSDDEALFFAKNNSGKQVSCRDVADLRGFYKKMLSWGFMPSDIPVEE